MAFPGFEQASGLPPTGPRTAILRSKYPRFRVFWASSKASWRAKIGHFQVKNGLFRPKIHVKYTYFDPVLGVKTRVHTRVFVCLGTTYRSELRSQRSLLALRSKGQKGPLGPKVTWKPPILYVFAVGHILASTLAGMWGGSQKRPPRGP